MRNYLRIIHNYYSLVKHQITIQFQFLFINLIY